jgi:hypothetical protein
MPNSPNSVGTILPTQDVVNTKFVAVAMVLGLKLQKPGIYITIDEKNPASTGGVGHFLFETNLQNSVANYLKIFEAGTADADLETYLATLNLNPAQLAALEKKIAEALIVYGRKFLDQYQIVVRYVKDEVKRFTITDGDPVLNDRGQVVGRQGFTVTQEKKNKSK